MNTLAKETRKMIKYRRSSLRDELQSLKKMERRTDAVCNILDTLPKKIQGRSVVSISFSGSCIFVEVNPKFKRFTEADTLLIVEWCAKQEKFRFTKDVNSSNGKFQLELRRYWRGFTYYIDFNSTSNIEGCELIEKEVTETRKIYEVKC